MSKGTYPLKLPASIKKAAQRLAKEDGVSLNQWIGIAVAQKVSATETAAEFFNRIGRGSSEDLGELLRMVHHRPPMAGDELPSAGE
jgi:hypothetical protein